MYAICLQVWATYSPVKNSPADARAKAAEGNPTHSATTGEMDIYKVRATCWDTGYVRYSLLNNQCCLLEGAGCIATVGVMETYKAQL